MSRTIAKLRNLEIVDPIPDELTNIDRLDYFYGMLNGLAKMMTRSEARTLRQLVRLAALEAGRILQEARASRQVGGEAEADPQNPPAVRRERQGRDHRNAQRHCPAAKATHAPP